jgi:hypothetical protein
MGTRDGSGGEICIGSFDGRFSSARDAAASTTASTVAGVRFEAIRAVWIALDSDHRKNDDSRGLGSGVDIFASATVAYLVGKLDDFAHFSPLSAPT